MNDCAVCGFPTLRRGAHADWCTRVADYLDALYSVSTSGAPESAHGDGTPVLEHHGRVQPPAAVSVSRSSSSSMRGSGDDRDVLVLNRGTRQPCAAASTTHTP